MKQLLKIYHWIVWNLLTRPFFVEMYLHPKYRFSKTAQSQPLPKPPFLVVSNHGTFFDPWIVGGYSRYPLGFMANDDGFRGGIITRWYLQSIGAFPKKKGAPDYRAMKTTLELLRSGKPVCIFPEGQTSWDGETQQLYPGIEKLVKHAACPLVSARLQGNFLTKPWWAKTTRKGKIRVTFSVHSPEKLRQLTNDELFAAIRQSIYQNDIKDPGNLAVPFTGTALAEGLERFVWICLQCGAEDTLSTTGDAVSCSACGHTVVIDAYCRIRTAAGGRAACNDLKDWADLHSVRVREAILRRPALLTGSVNVTLQREDAMHRFVDIDKGTMTLTPAGLQFEGATVKQEWPLAEIEDCVIQKKDIFEFRHGAAYQRFVFSGKSPMKWIYYFRYLKESTADGQQGQR